jgi:dCMP deaminase
MLNKDNHWLKFEKRYIEKLEVYMEICKNISSLSYDDKFKVGSVVVTEDFREICALGYNGNFKGGPNQRDSAETGKSGFLHGEENALLHLSKPYEFREKMIMFCTHRPCPMCAKRIVNSGIKRVIFKNEYLDMGKESAEIFSSSGVECYSLSEIVELYSLVLTNQSKDSSTQHPKRYKDCVNLIEIPEIRVG